MSTSKPPLHVLRGILRLLRPPKEAKAKPGSIPVTRQFVMKRYRASQYLQQDTTNHNNNKQQQQQQQQRKQEELRRLAEEYYTLQRDLAERKMLHQLDTGAEEQLSPMELSRRAAARAGLQLPDLNPNL